MMSNILFGEHGLEGEPVLLEFVEHVSQGGPLWVRGHTQTL